MVCIRDLDKSQGWPLKIETTKILGSPNGQVVISKKSFAGHYILSFYAESMRVTMRPLLIFIEHSTYGLSTMNVCEKKLKVGKRKHLSDFSMTHILNKLQSQTLDDVDSNCMLKICQQK